MYSYCFNPNVISLNICNRKFHYVKVVINPLYNHSRKSVTSMPIEYVHTIQCRELRAKLTIIQSRIFVEDYRRLYAILFEIIQSIKAEVFENIQKNTTTKITWLNIISLDVVNTPLTEYIIISSKWLWEVKHKFTSLCLSK